MIDTKRAKDQLKIHIREQNQAHILECAEKVFARQGLAKTTTQMIADEAALPKANIHYYFRSKKDLLEAVLENILELWLDSVSAFEEDDGPKLSLSRYINEKIDHSRENTNASKVFAMALIGEEPFVLDFLRNHFVKELAREKQIIESWVEAGLMKSVSTEHLFISLWALTQTYADFDAQIKIVLNKTHLTEDDYDDAKEFIIKMILSACDIK